MKLSQLKTIVKEAVKEAIQEEMKDILLEAVRVPKTVVSEVQSTPVATTPLPENDKMKLRENMMGILDGMRPNAQGTLNATTADMPLQVGSTRYNKSLMEHYHKELLVNGSNYGINER